MIALLRALWLVQLLRAVLRQTALWQGKEYRPDRLRAHLRLPSARRQILHPAVLGRLGVLAAALVVPAGRDAVAIALIALYSITAGHFLREIAERRVRRPLRTAKALGIGSAALLTIVAALTSLTSRGVRESIALPLLDLALPLVVAAFVLAAAPITAAQRAATIRRARERMRALPKLTTLGITGSYGKSSTKEFLATIVADRFRVLKTPANVNTEIGIAQHVLAHARSDHDVFVCEMGAYREGEIARAAAMVRPRIGILTAVGNQHLVLFGSREALARAKGELLAALPADGIAIVNGDDETCARLAHGTPARRVLRFGMRNDHDVWASAVHASRETLTLTLHIGTAQAPARLSLVGALHVPSFLAATAAAHALGMTVEEIAAAARDIHPLPRTMEPCRGGKGSFVIDDTYSANPDGVAAALETLAQLPAERRVAILTPMIELGDAAPAAHRRVGETLARTGLTRAVLVGSDYADEIVAGARSVAAGVVERIVVARDTAGALRAVEPLLGPNTVVLLEGRIPETLRSALRAHHRAP